MENSEAKLEARKIEKNTEWEYITAEFIQFLPQVIYRKEKKKKTRGRKGEGGREVMGEKTHLNYRAVPITKDPLVRVFLGF